LLLAALSEAEKLDLKKTPAYEEAVLALEELQEKALLELSESTPWDVNALKRALAHAK
jgi:hypothetical protein